MEKRLRDCLPGDDSPYLSDDRSGKMWRFGIAEIDQPSCDSGFPSLVQAGISGWRMHPTGIAGKPDFFFPVVRLAVFVDGCSGMVARSADMFQRRMPLSGKPKLASLP